MGIGRRVARRDELNSEDESDDAEKRRGIADEKRSEIDSRGSVYARLFVVANKCQSSWTARMAEGPRTRRRS